MKNIQLQKIYYTLRHRFATTNNAVLVIAVFIALSWAWGAVSVMERNYRLQKEIDNKNRQLKLVGLEVDTLRFQQGYYKSDEYNELAARQRLGLVQPGEKTLILPPNSKAAKAYDTEQQTETPIRTVNKPSNMQQWLNLLFGSNKE